MKVDGDLGAFRERVWREASEELARYLSAAAELGPGVAGAAAATIAGLLPQELQALLEAHFIAAPEVGALVHESAPAILQRLARSAKRTPVTGPFVRGAIDWSATVAARSAASWSRTLFVSDEATPALDVPANRALKATLEFVLATAAGVNVRLSARGSIGRPASLAARAASVGAAARAALRSATLAQVSAPRRPGQHDLRAADADRNRAYRQVSAVHRLRVSLLERRDPEALRAALARYLFVPGSEAKIFEIWALSRVAAALERVFGKPRVLGLLPSRSDGPVYSFGAAGSLLEVYYQRIPAIMRQESRYTAIFDAYSLGVSTRMPDIVLRAFGWAGERFSLIEVKASQEAEYIAEGAYKLLGYLKDFQAVLQPLAADHPSGMLVALDGFRPIPGQGRLGHPIWLSTLDRFDQEAEAFVRPLCDFAASADRP